jgi:enterochelin esterase-like enzyme
LVRLNTRFPKRKQTKRVVAVGRGVGALVATVLIAIAVGGCGSALASSGSASEPRARAENLAQMIRQAGGELLTVNFYSPALRRWADYLVYLPSDYTPSRRLPVFYMLHGMPGRPLAFTVNADVEPRLEGLIKQDRVPAMILVFPDGRIGELTATDSEWANTSSGQFDGYVVNVVRDVDHRFATIATRQDRVIAGLSAGAYGAMNLALHHLNLFSSVQVWSGYFTQTRTGVFARATPAQLAYNSPIDLVDKLGRMLARYPLRAFLFVGKNDSDRNQTAPMARALKDRGASVGYAIYSGGHSWGLWTKHIDQMLILAGHDMATPPGGLLGLRPLF